MFADRKDAGQKLGQALEKYKGQDVLVLAIPRGGVEVGYYVAEYLKAQLAVVVSRKLPLPEDPEAGFGAVAEDGSVFLYPNASSWIPENDRKRILQEQKKEIGRRIKAFREGCPLPDLKDRTVILVDDGIAMGSTMKASMQLCRHKQVSKLVVASPVAGPDVAEEMKELADDAVILETPRSFQAVAQVYEHWYDVPESEVREFIKKASFLRRK